MTRAMTYDQFHDIFNRYYASLCVFADRYVDDKALSADITQDVFFKLWERRTDFTDQLKIRSFLYTAVHNRALNELAHRRTVRDHEDLLNRFTVDEIFHERVIEEETYRMMLEEIDRLPRQMREIMLRALEGMQNKEIAADLGISVETVHSLKKIAYRKLRESLKDEYYFLLLLLILKNTL
ncbi:MAG: RNA polymerase sigma-70 factor [Bacteroidales bacterium]|nr:RNA polymerase sigma-70 factor [Bacteroidales bacterium]